MQGNLTLRLIGPNDYQVNDDGQRIGRIRYARERAPGIWLWHVHVHVAGAPFGSADDLDEAKAAFKAGWNLCKSRYTPEELAAAYRAMNLRESGQ